MIIVSRLSNSKTVNKPLAKVQVDDAMGEEIQSILRTHQGTSSRDLLVDQIYNAELWTALGRIYEKQREFAKGTAAYRHGSEIDPTGPDVAALWVRAALAAGDYGQAKKAIQHLRNIDPLRVGPALVDHPIMLEGRKVEEAAKAQEKPLAKVQIGQGPRTSGLIPQRPNKNTVPPQDPENCAAQRQV
jgi:tetratricopeptide (TPR) repeat protein